MTSSARDPDSATCPRAAALYLVVKIPMKAPVQAIQGRMAERARESLQDRLKSEGEGRKFRFVVLLKQLLLCELTRRRE